MNSSAHSTVTAPDPHRNLSARPGAQVARNNHEPQNDLGVTTDGPPPKKRSFKRRVCRHVTFLFCLTLVCSLMPLRKVRAQEPYAVSKAELNLEPAAESIWEHGVGEGFRSTAQSITLSAGATYGLAAFGSHEAHDLALVSLTYGHMLSPTWGEGHWYRGNLEFRLELFTGAQFSPSSEWLVGLTPHLRYNFATGTRWIPFVDGGAGVTATGIGPPDLSGIFEFNLQAGTGIQWFFKDNMALTLEARYVHWSCAGLSNPNLGLNGVTGMLGLTFFF